MQIRTAQLLFRGAKLSAYGTSNMHRSIFQQLGYLSIAYPSQHQHRLLQMHWKALLSEWIYAYLSISFYKLEHKHLVLVVIIILQLSWRSIWAWIIQLPIIKLQEPSRQINMQCILWRKKLLILLLAAVYPSVWIRIHIID